MDYLLSLFQEEDVIFPTERPVGGPPAVVDGCIYVEGVLVTHMESVTKEEQLLSWGATFAVFAQTPLSRRFENVACVMTRYVVETDEGRVPKKLASVADKLML